jgi:hypothetical protein
LRKTVEKSRAAPPAMRRDAGSTSLDTHPPVESPGPWWAALVVPAAAAAAAAARRCAAAAAGGRA